jgi:hypothetical protein
MGSDNTIFISYSHDSDGHRERVLALSERLRVDGFTALLDQYVNGTPNGCTTSSWALPVSNPGRLAR